VLVTACWLLLIAAVPALELASRRATSRVQSITRVVSQLWERRSGRLLLVVCWSFFGWHVFARYGVAR
jgi:hypothetical protein